MQIQTIKYDFYDIPNTDNNEFTHFQKILSPKVILEKYLSQKSVL